MRRSRRSAACPCTSYYHHGRSSAKGNRQGDRCGRQAENVRGLHLHPLPSDHLLNRCNLCEQSGFFQLDSDLVLSQTTGGRMATEGRTSRSASSEGMAGREHRYWPQPTRCRRVHFSGTGASAGSRPATPEPSERQQANVPLESADNDPFPTYRCRGSRQKGWAGQSAHRGHMSTATGLDVLRQPESCC